jgi:uncharacterized metal-binding protein YceD (DUF177 family)
MADTDQRLTPARLPRGAETPFDFSPAAPERTRLAAELDLLGLRKLRFAGRLIPEGARDWRLEAMLGATVVQPCVVSGDPVTTRLDEPVTRRYRADLSDPDEAEIEMPEDDTEERLPAVLDLSEVMAEALALALPLYPRAPGAVLESTSFAAPGVTPLGDDDVKPLAGLADLRARLAGGDTATGEAPKGKPDDTP